MSRKIQLTQIAERPLRADARRNYARILAAAEIAIAQHGAEASLEQVAEQAGVGSATLHRHFPSRWVLLQAVFRNQVESLCAQARELSNVSDPGHALVVWLRALSASLTANRGLAASLLREHEAGEHSQDAACHELIAQAGSELLQRAHDANIVRSEVSITELLTLINAISLVTEHDPEGEARAERLVDVVIEGIYPRAKVVNPPPHN